jgi:hypothetical protein
MKKIAQVMTTRSAMRRKRASSSDDADQGRTRERNETRSRFRFGLPWPRLVATAVHGHSAGLGHARRPHGSNLWRTANETSLKPARAAVNITLRSRRYGMSLSPMIVTRLLSLSFSLRITSRDASTSSSALSGWIRSLSTVSASLTEATTLPPTRISLPVTDDHHRLLGRLLRHRLGQLHGARAGSVSTPTLDIRKKIRIVNTSISDTRFMSTID